MHTVIGRNRPVWGRQLYLGAASNDYENTSLSTLGATKMYALYKNFNKHNLLAGTDWDEVNDVDAFRRGFFELGDCLNRSIGLSVVFGANVYRYRYIPLPRIATPRSLH